MQLNWLTRLPVILLCWSVYFTLHWQLVMKLLYPPGWGCIFHPVEFSHRFKMQASTFSLNQALESSSSFFSLFLIKLLSRPFLFCSSLRYEYLWADGVKFKRPVPLPAPQYVSHLMDWVEGQINNEDIFPTKMDVPFPPNFVNVCKKILTRLFRVFVHVYIHHFDRLVAMAAEAHVNTCYKHFYYFVTEFDLVAEKEFEPLVSINIFIYNSLLTNQLILLFFPCRVN